MILTDHVGEIAWTPLAGENLMCHGFGTGFDHCCGNVKQILPPHRFVSGMRATAASQQHGATAGILGEPDPRHFNYFAVAASFPT